MSKVSPFAHPDDKAEPMPPADGRPCYIRDGIFLLRLPMPFALDHVNVYLIEGVDGWTLIDCGLDTPENRSIWDALLASRFFIKPLRCVLVTHYHPDHIGLAHWIERLSGAQVYIAQREWFVATSLWRVNCVQQDLVARHYRLLGMNALQRAALAQNHYKQMVKELPKAVTLIGNNDALPGAPDWTLLPAPGHTPAHLCPWNADENVLVSGDHILPRITPNISFHTFSAESPLCDYLETLNAFSKLPCQLLLPAHHQPITHYHDRVRDLINHHHRQLQRLSGFLESPRTVMECVPFLFPGKTLENLSLNMAVGETAAHLLYLLHTGVAERTGKRVWRFIKK